MPGRITISTPTKPTPSATSRPTVVRSPSIGQASSATTSGAVRLIEAALAIGMVMMAKKNDRFDVISSAERRSCVPSRCVRSMPSPKRGTKAASMNRMWPKARAHETCREL